MNEYLQCHECEFHFTHEEIYEHRNHVYCMDCLWSLYQRGEQMNDIDVDEYCPVCGHQLVPIKCKAVCKHCGYMIGCSERRRS